MRPTWFWSLTGTTRPPSRPCSALTASTASGLRSLPAASSKSQTSSRLPRNSFLTSLTVLTCANARAAPRVRI
ncbi:MAG: hypothetical protein EB832_01145 [Thaumarchaeota archaeon S14]|nr:MAG: hypothetical protein EB832_01145 [Thaumarchaeota archaeon S14]